MKLKMFICLFIAAAFVIAGTAYADEEVEIKTANVYSYSEPLGEAGDFNGITLPEDAVFLDVQKADSASAGSALELITLEGADYNKANVSADGGYVEAVFKVPEEHSNDDGVTGTALGFGVYVSGKGSSGVQSEYVYATVSVSDETHVYEATLPISASKPCLVYIDAIGFDTEFVPDQITLKLKGIDTFAIEQAVFTNPYYTDSFYFEYQSIYDIPVISVLGGEAILDSSYIDVGTSKGEAVIFFSDSYLGQSGGAGKVKYISVGAAAGFEASLGIDTLGSSTTSQSFFSADEARGAAVFRMISGTGAIIKVRNADGEDTRLEEIEFYATDEKASTPFNAISSLTVEGDNLVGNGTLDYDTVTRYSKCSIGVYMISAVGDSDPILLGKTRVATRFSFELSLKEYAHAASDYMFYAAIITEHNVQKRVSEPKFATYASAKNQTKSRYGLYGVDPVSVYEAGSPYVMVDIDLSKLVQTSSLASYTVSRGGYVFELDRQYLNTLDAGMEFYRSAGVQVYAKLYSSEKIFSRLDGGLLTYSGNGEVMLRADVEEGANMYLAVTSFLCSRYPNITSFVLGSGVNSKITAGSAKTDLYDKAKNTALAARLIYGAASEVTDVFVTIPFATQDTFASAEVFAALVAERIAAIGQISWAAMYTDSRCELPSLNDNIIAAQHFNKTSVPMCSVYCYEPEVLGESLVDDYSSLCDDASSTAFRVVFLSEKGLDVQLGRQTLNKLKRELKAEGVHIFDMSASPAGEYDKSNFTGKAPLWDFTSSHSTLGWVKGYGVRSLSTAPEEYFSASAVSRVLRIVTENTAESDAGIILCSQKTPFNLSSAPMIEIVYSHDIGEAVDAVFVFGNGENRAEFIVPSDHKPDDDGKYRVICDLTEFSKLSTVAYMGVIVYSSESVSFDISSISALSYSLSDSEIAEIITSEDTEAQDGLPMSRILIVSAIAVAALVFTVRAFVIAVRRDRRLKNVIKPHRYRF